VEKFFRTRERDFPAGKKNRAARFDLFKCGNKKAPVSVNRNRGFFIGNFFFAG